MSDEAPGVHPTLPSPLNGEEQGRVHPTLPSPLNGEDLGGESACYAHYLDDDGRLYENWTDPGVHPTLPSPPSGEEAE